MKKLLAISVMALIMSGSAALAEEGKPDHKGPGHMFERADTDKNGTLSKEEFMVKHEETFKRLDTNGDNSISKEEIEAGRDKWKEMKKEHAEKKGENPVAPADAPPAE